ncbi:cell cycle protein MesJ [Legionella busanensis]|uniref:tRNA(Ile)-lysidine synthase n=1 Tax=Legionella busanensis TaxID=190655 RepID=A0A378JJ67_9GAMM|nr:tRNA lysidine(34) synthetase TilS [Legionella busanensis]STX51204.1 cell cycle protein MesJ [Legionella busanensis]
MNCSISATKNLWVWGLLIDTLLTSSWVNQLKYCNTLYVGFSGGLDSTVLLHILSKETLLADKITAVYINHGLSPKAEFWQSHCEKICQRFKVAFLAHKVSFNQSANVEERARQARYDFFHSIVKENDALILGHHLDDQAETVLLKLFRGAGIAGLSAMVDWRAFGCGYLARPLLTHSRSLLKNYALHHGLNWIEDESNFDCTYTRNFLRQQVIPLLQTRWPKVSINLARTAHHSREAQSNLDELAHLDYPNLNSVTNKLSLIPLQDLNRNRKQNILRVWLKKNTYYLPETKLFNRLVPEIIEARKDSIPELNWGNFCIYRYKNSLYLINKQKKNNLNSIEWVDFPNDLKLPEAVGTLKANLTQEGLFVPDGAHISIHFRRGGERFYWRKQTKILKKLLQEWHVPPWLRDEIPLIYINQQLAVIVGYAISDNFYNQGNQCYQFELNY